MHRIDEYLRIARELPAARSGPELTAALRDLERAVLTALEACAREGWRPGAGVALASALSAWRDTVVRTLYARYAPSDGVLAVAAVGGYGRRELAPGSDLDLLFLLPRRRVGPVEAAIQALQHQLWDLGYQVASSARTPGQAAADCREDPQLLTSILTARGIAGDARLLAALRVSAARALGASRRRFLELRRADLQTSVAGSGAGVLIKEPNLKSSPGALRSIQVADWLALAARGPDGVLGPEGRARLDRARDFLLYLRTLLHFLTARKEDVLRVEYQHAVAAVLRVRGSATDMMVKLMRHYYRRATDVVLALLEMEDRLAGGVSAGPRGPPDAARAFEACRMLAAERREPTGELVGYLRAVAAACPEGLARDRGLFLAFRDLLHLQDSYRALSALKLSGLLHVYLRPLRSVRHRILHNPFHLHTVDQHSLVAVRELESFGARAATDPDRYGLPAQVAARYTATLWVVKLTLLLHDVGKAYEGDHAKNGAEMVAGYLRELPTESLIKNMVVFLIENHLLLSTIARRGVQGDGATIDNFASEIIRSPYPEEALDFLYLLTCADASATNERGYTSYQAAALAGLYRETATLLERERAAGLPQSTQTAPHHLAALAATGSPDVLAFARDMGFLYTRVTPPEEILADWRRLGELERGSFDLSVSVFNDHLRVKILASDRPGLFSLLAGILLVNGADIVRASIHTWRGIAIDVFVVTDVYGNEILEKQMEKELEVWVRDLRASFERFWWEPEELDRVIAGIESRTRPPPSAFLRETIVGATRTGEDTLHLELACTDRPALLYDVTRRMAALGLDIRSAAIDTTGWYVHDIFEVRMPGGADDRVVRTLADELRGAAPPRV